jgi:hypothetical protein
MTPGRPVTRDRKSKEEETAVSISTPPAAERRPAFRAASPLLFDVAVPVGLYYLLSAVGVSDTLQRLLAAELAAEGPERPAS